MAIKTGSMREAINKIYQTLINDEEFMRLLYYPAMSSTNPDPLDPSLPNVLEMDEEQYWSIVEERVLLTDKMSDIEGSKMCRIYLSAGRRRPKFESYLLATQEVTIRLFVHEAFESDLRTLWISDRISELLAHEYIAGMGRLDYTGGDPMDAPREYKSYRHTYQFVTEKK